MLVVNLTQPCCLTSIVTQIANYNVEKGFLRSCCRLTVGQVCWHPVAPDGLAKRQLNTAEIGKLQFFIPACGATPDELPSCLQRGCLLRIVFADTTKATTTAFSPTP